MNWIEKLTQYAPDIAAAVATGGTSLVATGVRILGKELLGNESASSDEVQKAVESATPAQMIALKKANNDFVVQKMQIQAGEMASAREMYTSHNQQADSIADTIIKRNIWFIIALILVNVGIVYVFRENAAAASSATGLIAFAVRDLLAQIQSVSGFYFGSSLGSKSKDGKK